MPLVAISQSRQIKQEIPSGLGKGKKLQFPNPRIHRELEPQSFEIISCLSWKNLQTQPEIRHQLHDKELRQHHGNVEIQNESRLHENQ